MRHAEEVRLHPDLTSLSRAVAEEIVTLAGHATRATGRFTIVLAGGETPRTLYRLLADEYQERLPWPKIHLFWGDERYVPPDHSDSNLAMAHEILISRVPIPPHQVHPIPTDLDTPERAAAVYEALLRASFGETQPTFDLVLLGVGEDGHTASLFPGDPILRETTRWVSAVLAPPTYPQRRRITLTLPALHLAHTVFFLVSGQGKQATVRSLLQGSERARTHYPAAMVRPAGRLAWWINRHVGVEIAQDWDDSP